MLKYTFWILWSAELIFLGWMLMDEMKLKYLSMPMYIPLGFLWVLLALFVKWVLKSDTAALIMVGIPGIPLMLMGVFLLIVWMVSIISGPIRWN
jgi:hypothetical protein